MNQAQQTGVIAALTGVSVAVTEAVMHSPEEIRSMVTVPMVAIPIVIAVVVGQKLDK